MIALTEKEIDDRFEKLSLSWRLKKDPSRLRREWSFPDFSSGLEFVNTIGRIAERLNHHPSIKLMWGKVKVTIHTHTARGLTDLDFTFAQECDEIQVSV